MDLRNLHDVEPYTTKDGSEIRELLNERNSGVRNQSLAEARLPPGARTTRHHHPRTEEIYYIVAGSGRIEIDGEQRLLQPGDAVAIRPGQAHQIENTGTSVLCFLCCCAPGYSHDDTVLDTSPN